MVEARNTVLQLLSYNFRGKDGQTPKKTIKKHFSLVVGDPPIY
jgi:hypothetical protein